MNRQNQDPSKRNAQHILAREIVELAHGAADAKKAEAAHKDTFGQGAHTFSLFSLRNAIARDEGDTNEPKEHMKEEKELFEYKKAYAASSTAQPTTTTLPERPQHDKSDVVTLPLSMLQAGSFPHVLHAAGLASSKSEASRLIAKKGAYVIVPNSGPPDNPTALKWATIEPGKEFNPYHYLVDWEALVLRAGKSKIQICRIIKDEVDEETEESAEKGH